MIRRREQNSEASRRALLEAAKTAFAEHGFAATSLEDIVGPAGLTKGALYHHFDNKAAILESLYVAMEEELVARIATVVEGVDDPRRRFEVALDAFLEFSSEPAYVRIVLRESSAILGTAKGRELDQRIGLGLTESLVQDLIDSGLAPRLSVEIAARVLLAAVSEVAVTMSAASDPVAVRRDGRQVIVALVDGLASLSSAPRAAE